MSKFAYTALDSGGKEFRGVVDVESEADVAAILKQKGLLPTSVKRMDSSKPPRTQSQAAKPSGKGGSGGAKKKKGFSLNFQLSTPKIPPKELSLFTRQLSTLLDAGLPLIRALRTLERQAKNKMTKQVIRETADYVEGGFTFSEALSKHPKTFDQLFVNMVRAGETAGAIEIILNRLATFMEKSAKITAKIKSAMIYPAVVLCVAGGVTIFLMAFIVPKFKSIFSELLQGMPLPALTTAVMAASDFITDKIVHIVVGAVVLFIAYKLFKKTEFGRYWIDYFKYRVPVFGTLNSKTTIARFTRTLGTLLSSSVPVLNTLLIVRDTADNLLVKRAIQKVHDAVREGESVAVPLGATKLFPDMVISMVEVGEETGKLPEMLEKIADVYEDEVDDAVEALTSLIEPIMIVFMAVVVGTIVIAMFMPLIKIMQTLGG